MASSCVRAALAPLNKPPWQVLSQPEAEIGAVMKVTMSQPENSP